MYTETKLADASYPNAKSKSAFQDGLEFQDFVCLQLAREHIILQNTVSRKYQFEMGESLGGIEIKLDNLCTKTRRLSIEVAEKSRADMPNWTPSGIYRPDNTWLYIQGNYEVAFIFAKKFLRDLQNAKKFPIEELPTIQKFYLSMADAEKYAAKIMRFGSGE
jgi:hypothetical protein